jgi:DNA-binding transcriptional ArsR family regulator
MGRPGIVTLEPMALPEHELLARIFRTLGDSTRLRMIERLLEVGEASQSELIELVGATQSRASEHLSCLAWCGFVRVQRDGRTARYCLVGEHPEAFLRLARQFLRDNGNAVGGCTVLEESPDAPRVVGAAQSTV